MQIISLFHHLWFIRYVYCETRANDLKGRHRRTLYPRHEDWIKCPYDKG